MDGIAWARRDGRKGMDKMGCAEGHERNEMSLRAWARGKGAKCEERCKMDGIAWARRDGRKGMDEMAWVVGHGLDGMRGRAWAEGHGRNGFGGMR